MLLSIICGVVAVVEIMVSTILGYAIGREEAQHRWACFLSVVAADAAVITLGVYLADSNTTLPYYLTVTLLIAAIMTSLPLITYRLGAKQKPRQD